MDSWTNTELLGQSAFLLSLIYCYFQKVYLFERQSLSLPAHLPLSYPALPRSFISWFISQLPTQLRLGQVEVKRQEMHPGLMWVAEIQSPVSSYVVNSGPEAELAVEVGLELKHSGRGSGYSPRHIAHYILTFTNTVIALFLKLFPRLHSTRVFNS